VKYLSEGRIRTMEEPTSGLRLVEKTVEVLNLLADHGELTIAQIGELTGEPRSSLYRLLRRLEQLKLVENADRRGYFRPGTHLLHWGASVQKNIEVAKRALPTLQEMRRRTGLTAYLVVNRSGQAVCIERLPGIRVTSQVLQLGGSLPLHAGAAPRALLAFSPESDWDDYVAQHPLAPMTSHTPATAERLFEVLREERDRGYTVAAGDVSIGLASLGAPVYSHKGEVIAAISVSGLHDDILGDNLDTVSELVMSSAAEISAAMGYRG
jgi:DNA-binding IclR family transcriptional regulator